MRQAYNNLPEIPLQVKAFLLLGAMRKLFIPQQQYADNCEKFLDTTICLILFAIISFALEKTTQQIRHERGLSMESAKNLSTIALVAGIVFFNRTLPSVLCGNRALDTTISHVMQNA